LPLGSRTRFCAPLTADRKIEIDPDAAGFELEWTTAARPRPPRGSTTEHAVEDVLEACAAATRAAAAAERIGFEAAPGRAGTAARVAARKTLEARLAIGVDLAAIELLALVLVADDLVGGIDLGKARGRLRIVLVVVGMMFLGELAIGALDRRSAGAPRHPQDLIGVAHSVISSIGKIRP
jgi:hypothetical protein